MLLNTCTRNWTTYFGFLSWACDICGFVACTHWGVPPTCQLFCRLQVLQFMVMMVKMCIPQQVWTNIPVVWFRNVIHDSTDCSCKDFVYFSSLQASLSAILHLFRHPSAILYLFTHPSSLQAPLSNSSSLQAPLFIPGKPPPHSKDKFQGKGPPHSKDIPLHTR